MEARSEQVGSTTVLSFPVELSLDADYGPLLKEQVVVSQRHQRY